MQNFENTHIPPQAVEVEANILGSMLMEPDAIGIALTELSAADFYDKRHQLIYNEITRVFNAGKDVDMLSVEAGLIDKNNLGSAGGTGYLADLLQSVTSSANIDFHIQIVKEKSIRRQMIRHYQKSIDAVYNPETDTYEQIGCDERFIYKLLTGGSSRQMQTMQQVMKETLLEIEAAQGAKDGVIGMPSGLPHDELTSGCQKRKFYVFAGRPSTGKTIFGAQHAINFAKQGNRPGILSLEMDNTSLGKRLIQMEAQVDPIRARTGRLTDEELKCCHQSAEELAELGIVFDDTTEIDPSLLRVKARMMKQQSNIDALFIDYIQLVKGSNDARSREQEVSEVSRTCKLLAKELDIAVIAMAQLSRKPEDRRGWGKRPQNGDLRESGAIEQDADVVIMLFRPEMYGIENYPDGKSTEGICEVIVTKQRNGPVGTKKVLFDKDNMQFKKIDLRPEPQEASKPINNWYEADESPF